MLNWRQKPITTKVQGSIRSSGKRVLLFAVTAHGGPCGALHQAVLVSRLSVNRGETFARYFRTYLTVEFASACQRSPVYKYVDELMDSSFIRMGMKTHLAVLLGLVLCLGKFQVFCVGVKFTIQLIRILSSCFSCLIWAWYLRHWVVVASVSSARYSEYHVLWFLGVSFIHCLKIYNFKYFCVSHEAPWAAGSEYIYRLHAVSVSDIPELSSQAASVKFDSQLIVQCRDAGSIIVKVCSVHR